MRELLNKSECNALKGVSILIIMWHNLVLMLENVVKVNEHTYNVQYTHDMINSFMNPSYMTTLDIISHWVLIGVLGITFISGYGLVLKYEQSKKNQISSARFIASHYEKLIMLMAVGLFFYFLVRCVVFKSCPLSVVDVVGMLSFTANYLPNASIKPMPFWYFGMIFQLYIVYCFFLYPFRRKGSIGHWAAPLATMIIGLLPMIIFASRNGVLCFLRYNFPIGIVPFSMGVLAARYCHGFVNRSCLLALIALIILIVFTMIMELNVYTWLILATPAYVIIAILIVKSLPGLLLNWAAQIGALSSMIYIIHPSIRLLFKNMMEIDPYKTLLFYTLACLALAIPANWLFKRIPRFIKV